MAKLDPVILLALCPTFKGRALAYLLIASLLLTIVQFGLIADNFGAWQGFILWGMGPLHIVYLAVLFFHLHKSKDETIRTSRIPWCLARRSNIFFIGLCDGVWIAGAGYGLWLYNWYNEPTDDWHLSARALASTVFGLLEAIVLFAVLVFCIMARRERLRDPQELDLTAHPDA